MAFAAAKVADLSLGNKRGELWSFTELGTDTGGSFTVGLTVEGVFVSASTGTAAAIRAAVSGQTVTVTNAAGPTGGYVLLIGY